MNKAQEITSQLWEMANRLRSNMDASEYRNYILGFMFYRYLSEHGWYAHVATIDEIKENDYNLNIPRYVDTFEPEPPVDLGKLTKEMEETQKEIEQTQSELLAMMKELTSKDEKTQNDLNEFIKMLENEVRRNG